MQLSIYYTNMHDYMAFKAVYELYMIYSSIPPDPEVFLPMGMWPSGLGTVLFILLIVRHVHQSIMYKLRISKEIPLWLSSRVCMCVCISSFVKERVFVFYLGSILFSDKVTFSLTVSVISSCVVSQHGPGCCLVSAAHAPYLLTLKPFTRSNNSMRVTRVLNTFRICVQTARWLNRYSGMSLCSDTAVSFVPLTAEEIDSGGDGFEHIMAIITQSTFLMGKLSCWEVLGLNEHRAV